MRVQTADGRIFAARRLIAAPGAWAPRVFAMLGIPLAPDALRVVRQTVAYWRVDEADHEHIGVGRMPIFVHYGATHNDVVYGFPARERPGMIKVCYHDEVSASIDADDVAASPWPPSETALDQVRSFFAANMAIGIDETAAFTEPCLYTIPRDDVSIIDSMASDRRVLVLAGMHGEGFKLAPVLGHAAAHWTVHAQLPPSLHWSPFSLARLSPRANL